MEEELLGLCQHILRLEIHVCKFRQLVETGHVKCQQEESVEACKVKKRNLMHRLLSLSLKMKQSRLHKGTFQRRHDTLIVVKDEPAQVVGKAGRINAILEKHGLAPLVVVEIDGVERYPFFRWKQRLTFMNLEADL